MRVQSSLICSVTLVAIDAESRYSNLCVVYCMMRCDVAQLCLTPQIGDWHVSIAAVIAATPDGLICSGMV
jgi:hypothetical protein